VVLVFLSLGASLVAEAAPGKEIYFLKIGKHRLLSSGAASTTASLATKSGPIEPGPEPVFIWRLSYFRFSTANPNPRPNLEYLGSASPKSGSFNLLALDNASVRLRAKIERGGVENFAQSDFMLFGGGLSSQAQTLAREEQEEQVKLQEQLQDWPLFKFSSNSPAYWPQTGHNFTLEILGPRRVSGPLEVWEEFEGEVSVRPVAWVKADNLGRFTFNPPHDQRLNQAGASATKLLIFRAPLEGSAYASLSLRVHRSRVVNRNMPLGLSIFASVCALTAVGFIGARERGKRPWT
jgi:hypothetical protein